MTLHAYTALGWHLPGGAELLDTMLLSGEPDEAGKTRTLPECFIPLPDGSLLVVPVSQSRDWITDHGDLDQDLAEATAPGIVHLPVPGIPAPTTGAWMDARNGQLLGGTVRDFVDLERVGDDTGDDDGLRDEIARAITFNDLPSAHPYQDATAARERVAPAVHDDIRVVCMITNALPEDAVLRLRPTSVRWIA